VKRDEEGEPSPTPDYILTLAKAAAYLRMSRSWIYRLARARKIPASKVRSVWRFNREHIDEWRLRQESGWDAKNKR